MPVRRKLQRSFRPDETPTFVSSAAAVTVVSIVAHPEDLNAIVQSHRVEDRHAPHGFDEPTRSRRVRGELKDLPRHSSRVVGVHTSIEIAWINWPTGVRIVAASYRRHGLQPDCQGGGVRKCNGAAGAKGSRARLKSPPFWSLFQIRLLMSAPEGIDDIANRSRHSCWKVVFRRQTPRTGDMAVRRT